MNLISKELFIESMNALKNQRDHDEKCSDALQIVFPETAFVGYYDNHHVTNQLTKILKLSMNDDHKDSWIDYFIWELNFGKEYKLGCARWADGRNIDLSSLESLYDFLIENNEGK